MRSTHFWDQVFLSISIGKLIILLDLLHSMHCSKCGNEGPSGDTGIFRRDLSYSIGRVEGGLTSVTGGLWSRCGGAGLWYWVCFLLPLWKWTVVWVMYKIRILSVPSGLSLSGRIFYSMDLSTYIDFFIDLIIRFLFNLSIWGFMWDCVDSNGKFRETWHLSNEPCVISRVYNKHIELPTVSLEWLPPHRMQWHVLFFSFLYALIS